MTQYWFARLRNSTDDYGTWVPTGETEFMKAQDYVQLHHRRAVREWLLMPVAF